MEITSAQNPRIKHLLLLQQKSQHRRKEGLFVVEGVRELQHCIEAGFEIDSLFVCEDMVGTMDFSYLRIEPFTIPRQLYEKVAYRGSTEGVIAVVRER